MSHVAARGRGIPLVGDALQIHSSNLPREISSVPFHSVETMEAFFKNRCATLGSTMQEGFINRNGERVSFIRFMFAAVGNVLTGKRSHALENHMPPLNTSNVAYTVWCMKKIIATIALT